MAQTTIQGSFLGTDLISAQTPLTTGLATTDELIVSDAGVIKRMDISVLEIAATQITASGTLPALNGAALTALSAANITASGTLPALNGAALTALTAANITASGTLPALNGSALTALNADNIGSGTVPVARLGDGNESNSTFLRGDNTWAAAGGGTTINGATVNELVTVASCTDELDAEANLTFDGTTFTHQTTGATASIFARYSADVTAPDLRLIKSRGTSLGATNAIQSGDKLGRISWYGADGNSLESGAYVEVLSGATWSDSNRQTYMDTYITPSGGSTTNTLTTRLTSDGQLRLKSGQVAAPSVSFLCDINSGLYSPSDNSLRIATNGIDMFNIHEGSGGWNIEFGDTGNSNGDRQMTLNQGCKDNIILAFKSSDVGHTFTGLVEGDTFGQFAKMCGNTGGLRIESYNGTSSATMSFMVKGYAKDACTNKNASGHAPIEMRSAVSSGTGITQYGNMNMFSVSDIACGTVKFLVDLDGDIYYDGGSSGFDIYCDVGLVRALSTTMAQTGCKPSNLIHSKWDDYVKENEQKLVELGILGDYVVDVPANKRGLVNGSQLQRLHNGAIWQLYTQLMDTKEELDSMKLQVQALQEGR